MWASRKCEKNSELMRPFLVSNYNKIKNTNSDKYLVKNPLESCSISNYIRNYVGCKKIEEIVEFQHQCQFHRRCDCTKIRNSLIKIFCPKLLIPKILNFKYVETDKFV